MDSDWSSRSFTTAPPSPTRYYYVKDHLGTVRAVVRPDASEPEGYRAVEVRDYYPFGMLMPGRNTMNLGTREGFTGKERDEETGLDYFGARFYMPALGRWMSPDPLADDFPGWSPYNYVLNNPLGLVDPTGMAPDDWYLNNETGAIEWINGSGEQEGYTHLGEDITFTFSSYIDGSTWDGPAPATAVQGTKLTTSLAIDAHSGPNGELAGVDVSFGVNIGKTAGIAPGQPEVPGQPNLQVSNTLDPNSFSAMLEQHTMVHPVEAAGLNALGYDYVNVAQRLSVQNRGGTLGVRAATDVFPSAQLVVQSTAGAAHLMTYRQPSFVATHKRGVSYVPSPSSGVRPVYYSRRPPFQLHARYSSGY